ncbi:G-type lectin S-receptor-like serine/threonine-protein kinase [Trifolium pratense]|uniref:non-specific serine/threonine protein kinase n=1 Tax=Trifolium pratense TaxID=57577 RepID=A0A2K3L3F3_TRIPR|nr:G-type lectin S-receptor-like serine/threonine-protein kinase [Trifolium pratense]
MQTTLLPKGVCKQIEKLMHNFIWGATNIKRTGHTVAWEDICRPRDQGGLGIRNVHLYNKSLLMKVAWNMLASPGSVWKDVISGMQWNIGNGKRIRFWTNPWLPSGKSKTEGEYERHENDMDLPLLNLSTIIIATDNFSEKNKIGEGGFGPVYLGKLGSGLEIAVKRLSQSSKQGMREFINEVKVIANVQYRNLVKLIGCCIQRHEKLLVYEYMSNGSLDYFIFDRTKSRLLDWPKRFQIICGIARGLLYLHQDSRLRIIHRDLKTSNVLLGDTLSPIISYFGMARTFGGNTNIIVGTYGYMAPEYAIDGQFSVKYDVFSFGILILEIICGKKNRVCYRAKQTLNLVAYAWTFWEHERALQIIDSNIEDSTIDCIRSIRLHTRCTLMRATIPRG